MTNKFNGRTAARINPTIERLQSVLDIHGADTERWPADERDALTALIATSAPAAQAVAEARALDQLLAMAPAASGTRPLELTARIVAATRMPVPTSARRVPAPPLKWLVGGLLAASVLMGFWLGSLEPVAGWIDPVLLAQSDTPSDTSMPTDSDLGLGDGGDIL